MAWEKKEIIDALDVLAKLTIAAVGGFIGWQFHEREERAHEVEIARASMELITSENPALTRAAFVNLVNQTHPSFAVAIVAATNEETMVRILDRTTPLGHGLDRLRDRELARRVQNALDELSDIVSVGQRPAIAVAAVAPNAIAGPSQQAQHRDGGIDTTPGGGWVYLGEFDRANGRWLRRYFNVSDNEVPEALEGRSLSLRDGDGGVYVRTAMPDNSANFGKKVAVVSGTGTVRVTDTPRVWADTGFVLGEGGFQYRRCRNTNPSVARSEDDSVNGGR